MKVVGLKVKGKNKEIKSRSYLNLNRSKGILEEASSRKRDKQISLLDEKISRLIEGGKVDGLCTRRFYENITVRGLDANELSIGSRIEIANTLQQVTHIGKRCFKECRIVEQGEPCELSGSVIFTQVLKGGRVSLEANVKIRKED